MENEIPKIIHYCWFGGKPLPKLAKKCIRSWQHYLPDYEIKRWDESNFDINSNMYVKEAYAAGKFAFVSDYARFKILYDHGGLYFDTDVQVIKKIDDIVAKGPFMGCQNKAQIGATPNELGVAPGLGLGVNPGLGLGVNPGLGLYRELIDMYDTLSFLNEDGSLNLKTVVDYTTEILVNHGLKNTDKIQEVAGVSIYPWDYFCPMSPSLVLDLTSNSRTIHLFSASWCSPTVKFRKIVKRALGYRMIKVLQPVVMGIRKIMRKCTK